MDSEGSAWSLRRSTQTSVGEIAWDRVGDGPPVVLVRGTPTRSLLWRKVAPVLAERRSVYLYDLLGYGESERHVDHDVSIAVQGRLLAELVRGWGLDRPALVGHDIGGAVVLRAHLLEGVAARALALVDAVVRDAGRLAGQGRDLTPAGLGHVRGLGIVARRSMTGAELAGGAQAPSLPAWISGRT